MGAAVSDATERRLFDADEWASPHGAPAARADAQQPALPRPDAGAARSAGGLLAWSLPVARHLLSSRRAWAEAASLEIARGTAFCFVPVLMIAGALAYFFAAAEPPLWWLTAAAAVPLAAMPAVGPRPVLRMVFAAAFCVALGALLAKGETLRAGTKMLGGEISTRLTGRVVSMDHLASGRVRLLIDVVATERPKLRYAPDRVRVSARKVPPTLAAGDVVTGAVRLLPPLGPTRPGGYDFSFESYFDGIGAVGFFLTDPMPADAAPSPSWRERFGAGVENARDRIAARIRERIAGPEGEIAAALIAGVRAGIPEEVNESLRQTGLAHILSISGLHMALVAAWTMGAMRLGFACFQNFAVRHPVRKYAAGVALIALAAYLFISGYQVAAQRSFIMIAIMLTAVLFDRAALTMRNLALAAIVILAVSPHEAAGPSFQMSFGATAALIGAYAAWSAHRRRQAASAPGARPVAETLRRAASYVGGLAATSLLAGAATAVFGAYHFQRVSPLGLAANLAAMPVVSLLVMPFALLGVVLMPLGLDWLPFSVMGFGLRIVVAVSNWLALRSPLDAVGMMAPAAAILLSAALVLAALPTTWLRMVALPFAAAGLTLWLMPPRPDILIAEDPRLVAIRGADGALHVNRARPNSFTVEDWQRATAAGRIVKPAVVEASAGELLRSDAGGAGSAAFRCSRTTCVAASAAGRVMTTDDAGLARSACGRVDLIVLDDATAANICAATPTLVVTRRDLALRGSAMLLAGPPGGRQGRVAAEPAAQPHGDATAAKDEAGLVAPAAASASRTAGAARRGSAYELRFAVTAPHRPWHAHRRFSRAARGLAPWKPDKAKAGAAAPTSRPSAAPSAEGTGRSGATTSPR